MNMLIKTILVLISTPAWGQVVGLTAGASGTGSGSQYSLSLNYRQSAFSFWQEKFNVELGARYSHYSKASEFDVGTSRESFVSSVDINSLNLLGSIEYKINDQFKLGMNIDLIGFSHGVEKDIRTTTGATGKVKPVGFNLLLGGKNDRGSLNSEFYASADLSDNCSLRVGMSHQVVEYGPSLKSETAQRFYDIFFLGFDLKI
jgi:hypothetical protein